MTRCLFCNNIVNVRSKEHVIPDWLLRKTKSKNKAYNLGFDYEKLFSINKKDTDIDLNKLKYRYNMGKYTFPACLACNTRFSSLEGVVSGIFEEIENQNAIKSENINVLMVWFDKVRVATWFGQTKMNGKPWLSLKIYIVTYDLLRHIQI